MAPLVGSGWRPAASGAATPSTPAASIRCPRSSPPPMPDRNLFIAMALSLLVLILWGQLQEPPPAPPGDDTAAAGAPPAEGPAASPAPPAAPIEPTPERVTPAAQDDVPERTVDIETPLYEARFSSRGGKLLHWELRKYFDAEEPGKPPIVLADTTVRERSALSTPFEELGLGDWSMAGFALERPAEHELVFSRTHDGVTVRKRYLLDPESYLLRLLVTVENARPSAVTPRFQLVWPEEAIEKREFNEYALVAYQDGSLQKQLVSGAGEPGFFDSLTGSGPDADPLYRGDVEWAGAETRYFLAAMVPSQPRDASAEFVTVERGRAAETSLFFEPVTLPTGQAIEREFRVFIGPKEPERLEAVGADLGKSIDLGYSWIAPLTRFFIWLLHACYAVVPNYGVAIILLTVLVRLVTAPLTAKQMSSMKRMQALQPRIKAMQEKYADDRQKQSEEMMKLYRESGVNPLGGCFPILLQFPVFIGLYYALQSSIELRQAHFFGWIDDLSAPETLFTVPGIDLPVRLLPLLMGLSMVVQQRLSPTPSMDPAQARMMMTLMPIMFTVLFYTFPSGLVLYWLVSNVLAAAHQWWITRSPSEAEPAAAGARGAGGKR